MSKRKRAKKLRKKLAGRGLVELPVFVVCTGKSCAPRAKSRALVAAAETIAAGRIDVTTVGCLHICKRGPIAAAVRGKKVRVKKRIDAAKATRMIERLARRPAVST